MSNRVEIRLPRLVDCETIEKGITADSEFFASVFNVYYPDGDPAPILNIADWDSDYIAAFKKVIDALTFAIHEDAWVWKITEDDKTFNLESSYVRDDISTAGTLTPIDDNAILRARFEVPGFVAPQVVDINIYYNEDFDPGDLTKLASIGIVLTGNGAEFEVANSQQFMVSFYKPAGATSGYVIDYDFRGKIFNV
jgi:hypothetical protein